MPVPVSTLRPRSSVRCDTQFIPRVVACARQALWEVPQHRPIFLYGKPLDDVLDAAQRSATFCRHVVNAADTPLLTRKRHCISFSCITICQPPHAPVNHRPRRQTSAVTALAVTLRRWHKVKSSDVTSANRTNEQGDRWEAVRWGMGAAGHPLRHHE